VQTQTTWSEESPSPGTVSQRQNREKPNKNSENSSANGHIILQKPRHTQRIITQIPADEHLRRELNLSPLNHYPYT